MLLFPRYETTHYRKHKNPQGRKTRLSNLWHPPSPSFPLWLQCVQGRKRRMRGGLPQYRWHGRFLQCPESADRKNKIVFQR